MKRGKIRQLGYAVSTLMLAGLFLLAGSAVAAEKTPAKTSAKAKQTPREKPQTGGILRIIEATGQKNVHDTGHLALGAWTDWTPERPWITK